MIQSERHTASSKVVVDLVDLVEQNWSSVDMMSERLGLTPEDTQRMLLELVEGGKIAGRLTPDGGRFFKTDIKLITANGTSIPVGQYNKPSVNYNDFTILDRRWSEYSIGVCEAYPDMNEVVVDGGIITDIRLSQPAVEIPQSGYVILTRLPGMQKIIDNFQVGDPVNLSIATTPDWSYFKTSMTGGAILIKDGKIPSPFSINISGKRARTAAGCR